MSADWLEIWSMVQVQIKGAPNTDTPKRKYSIQQNCPILKLVGSGLHEGDTGDMAHDGFPHICNRSRSGGNYHRSGIAIDVWCRPKLEVAWCGGGHTDYVCPDSTIPGKMKRMIPRAKVRRHKMMMDARLRGAIYASSEYLRALMEATKTLERIRRAESNGKELG